MNRCPTARSRGGYRRRTDEEGGDDGESVCRGGGWWGLRRPVKDAPRCQGLTGLQWAAVDGELHDAADEVVGGDLTAPMKDGLY